MLGSFTLRHDRDHAGNARGGQSRPLMIALVAIGVEIAVMRVRGYPMGRNVVVRCRDGHLFTTIWIPGASLKAIRLGWLRFQRCPVGHHWSIVTLIRESELTWEQKRVASEHRDIRIP